MEYAARERFAKAKWGSASYEGQGHQQALKNANFGLSGKPSFKIGSNDCICKRPAKASENCSFLKHGFVTSHMPVEPSKLTRRVFSQAGEGLLPPASLS